METGAHVTLPTYFKYKFSVAMGLDNSPELQDLKEIAVSTSPPRDQLKLCNGMSAFCTRNWVVFLFLGNRRLCVIVTVRYGNEISSEAGQ